MHTDSTPLTCGAYLTILVAALGYFVDIYDLLLFSIVRTASLTSLGLSGQALTDTGLLLHNIQMLGLLLGGIVWGIMGDRRGRLTVLFGSIFLYSVANILNGFVTSIPAYAVLRFVAGVGLAGELGAGITLIAEILSPKHRGYGTTVVATIGLMGAVVASFVADYAWNWTVFGWQPENWRVAYFIGGGLGLVLLALRVSLAESHLFEASKQATTGIRRGDFLRLFDRKRLGRYLACIAIGVPIWYMVGLLVFLSPEFSQIIGVEGGAVRAGTAILTAYIGLSLGDILCGLLSQWLRSRKRAVGLFLGLSLAASAYYLGVRNISLTHFYTLCFAIGFAGGFWAMFVTIASEQFGTNLRATVTTTVPNFVRGSVNLITLGFVAVRQVSGSAVVGAGVVGATCFLLAVVGLYSMAETFGKPLDYQEE